MNATAHEPRFMQAEYIIRKRVMVLLGSAVDITTPDGQPVLFCQQKAFRLREDIRVYTDQGKTQELLHLQARHILDFSGAFDITWVPTGEWLGTVRRQGLKSIVRDHWDVLDRDGNVTATIEEDSLALALVRRLLTALVPQRYDYKNAAGELLAEMDQFFNPFVYKARLRFRDYGTGQPQDRRLLLATALLLATIEGREDS
jgi:uncharacterized protein YxjI